MSAKNERSKMIGRILGLVVISIFLIATVTPLVLYSQTIGALVVMPDKPVQSMEGKEALELWGREEICTPAECSKITPYWGYRWLYHAIINDFVTPLDVGSLRSKVSSMASQVAIHHMRQIEHKTKGMGWWHLTHMFLGIWLQRNWDLADIAGKFREITA